jgi:hypothetical protein
MLTDLIGYLQRLEDALAPAPAEDLKDAAAHWLQTAIDSIPLDESPEEIATGLWSAVGGCYRSLPLWTQEAAYTAWLDRNPGEFKGRRKKAERAHLQRLEAWSQGWACFVEGRHDT